MKKIILVFPVLLFLILQAHAENFQQFCSKNSPKRNITGGIASFSGFNVLARNVAENQIEKAIKKETGSKFKIKINNFFTSNILNGEIKSIKATSKKYDYDGIYLSDIKIETICSYNHINFSENVLYFKENMVLKYDVFLTEDDLNKTLNSQKLDKTIAKILKKITKYNLILPLAKTLKNFVIPVKIDEYNNAKLYIEDIKTVKSKVELIGYIVILKNK